MKERDNNKGRRLYIRVSEAEYGQIQTQFSKTTDRKLSGYARKILLGKPVTIIYHNQSLEDIVMVLTKLQSDLNGIANNYNQAVHKLHALEQIPEYGSWILTYERDRKKMLEDISEIKVFIRKTAGQWLQS
jgi:hypothetical protein